MRERRARSPALARARSAVSARARAARFADVFWNYHSADNSSDYDYGFNGNVTHVPRARAARLFVLCAGPYVCAEWPAGGVPAWVESARRRRDGATPDASGMTLRPSFPLFLPFSGERHRRDADAGNNSAWLAETQRWMEAHFAEIERVPAARHGGNVLASQIENSDRAPTRPGRRRVRATARARARARAARGRPSRARKLASSLALPLSPALPLSGSRLQVHRDALGAMANATAPGSCG